MPDSSLNPQLAAFETKTLIAEVRRRRGFDPTQVDDIISAAEALELGELGSLRRQVNALWEQKTKYLHGLLPDERALLDNKDYLGCVRAVRERVGVGLADAKALVDQWKVLP
jgi:ribosomal protein L7/L12